MLRLKKDQGPCLEVWVMRRGARHLETVEALDGIDAGHAFVIRDYFICA